MRNGLRTSDGRFGNPATESDPAGCLKKNMATDRGETTGTDGGGILMPRVKLKNITSFEPFI
jgi:hypothetical protein